MRFPESAGKASHRVPVVLEPLRRRVGEGGRAFAKRSVQQIKQALLRQRAIGQGFNLVTPIQLAQVFSVLANGGTLHRPHLIKHLESWNGEVTTPDEFVQSEPTGLDRRALERVRQSLIATVEDSEGTGRRARVEGVTVAGKTGTSQVVRLERIQDLADEQIPVRYRDHALFAAFAPAEAPEIALAVVVEHAGKGGGAVAAPIAQKVLARFFEKRALSPEPGEAAETDVVVVAPALFDAERTHP